MSLKVRAQGYFIFLKQHLLPILLMLLLFNSIGFFVNSYFNERNDNRRQAEALTALREAVLDIKSNTDENSKNTNTLITKADANSRALRCIMDYLGTGDAIERSQIRECQRRSRINDDGTVSEPPGTGQQNNGQNQQGGVNSGQNGTVPPPAWLDILNGAVQIQDNPLDKIRP